MLAEDGMVENVDKCRSPPIAGSCWVYIVQLRSVGQAVTTLMGRWGRMFQFQCIVTACHIFHSRDMAMRLIFRGFCINLFGIGTYTTFQAVPILTSNLRRYSYSGSHRHSDSAIRGATNSLTWQVGESLTLRLSKSSSWWLPDSPSWLVNV